MHYGATELPVTAAPNRALTVIGSYLKACLNHYVAPAWATVAPGQSVVKTLFVTENPEENRFVEKELPGLFIWPTAWAFERIADDWQTRTTELSVLWLPHPTSLEKYRVRRSIFDPITATIDAVLFKGRDRAWVEDGDPDPYAASRGSSIVEQAGLLKPFSASRASIVTITLEMDGAPAKNYPAVQTQISITELFDAGEDPLTFYGEVAPAALNLTVSLPDGLTVEHLNRQGGFSNGFDFGFQNYELVRAFDSGLDAGFG